MIVNSFPPVPRMDHILYEYDRYPSFRFLHGEFSIFTAAVWFHTRYWWVLLSILITIIFVRDHSMLQYSYYFFLRRPPVL